MTVWAFDERHRFPPEIWWSESVSFVLSSQWRTTKTTVHLMRSRKVLIDYLFAGIRWITMCISIRGIMPRKSIESGCTPCTLAAKVLPKGIIFANGFAFTGSRGTGSHCQLNRGINPGLLYSPDPSGSVSYELLHFNYVVKLRIFLPVLRNH